MKELIRYSIFSLENEKAKEIKELVLKQLNDQIYDDEKPKYVIVIGGDGTYLRAIRKYINIIDECIFVSINCGKLGFYANINSLDDFNILDLINSHYETVSHNLLVFNVNGKGKYYAINEVSVYSVPVIGSYKVYIDGKHIEDFYGNGLLISTQSGSTGLNKSYNGAIIDEKIKALELTEIAGIQSNAYSSIRNSLVLDASRVIYIEGKNCKNNLISYDTERINLDEFRSLEVRYSNLKVKNIVYNKKDFLERVKTSFIK